MNRRSFLKSAGLLIGGLYLSGRAYGTILSNDRGKLIRGRVTASGKGIANVAVSDGFTVVRTDQKGKYAIQTNQETEHLFMSTPSGYEIRQVDGFAAIYVNIHNRHYDFDLRKTSYNDSRHFFLALGDPQVRVKEDSRQFSEESIPDIINFLQQRHKERFHGVSLGDSIWDRHVMWEPYKNDIKRINIPFFQVVGNHDKTEITGEQTDDNSLFKRHFGPAYYSFNRGKAHYVVLDNVRYQNIKSYDGYVSEQQLNWLEQDLQGVAKDQPLFIYTHIPTHNAVKNRDALVYLLDGFQNVHFLSGHTHQNTNKVISSAIYEHTVASLCGAWWTGPVCTDGTPRGYAVFEVNGNEVTWFYKSVGHDENYQFRTSVQKLNHGLHRIMVNVWNYDPDWKVEWFADGQPMGSLEQIKGFDELAVALYKGKELPKERREWVEPKKTDHLFIAQTNARSVLIRVTDRFGNKFEEKINILR